MSRARTESELTREDVLSFLLLHQPMTEGDEADGEIVEMLNRCRLYLQANPEKEGLEALLGVFGRGDGSGVYQLIEETVAAHSAEDVIAVLSKSLQSASDSVRYWCAQIASGWPDERLVDGIVALLRSGGVDARYAAVTALEINGGPRARTALRQWLQHETDPELREAIIETIGNDNDWT